MLPIEHSNQILKTYMEFIKNLSQSQFFFKYSKLSEN